MQIHAGRVAMICRVNTESDVTGPTCDIKFRLTAGGGVGGRSKIKFPGSPPSEGKPGTGGGGGGTLSLTNVPGG